MPSRLVVMETMRFLLKRFLSKVDSCRLLWAGFQLAIQLISNVCFKRLEVSCISSEPAAAGLRVLSGVHQSVNEWLASCNS